MGKPKNPPRVAENEARAVLRMVRISPQKLNLVAQAIRGLTVEKALNELKFSRKRIAGDVYKLVWSAKANAEEKGLDIDSLFVTQAHVGKNLVLKRSASRARGRGTRIEKPFAQITVVVREMPEALEALKNRKKQPRDISPDRRKGAAQGATA